MPSGSPDVVIIGSGMGGATLAYGIAGTGARILILERGEVILPGPDCRDPVAIFAKGVFRPDEEWLDGAGHGFNPGNYYYVGGNSKFYGAVLFRFRERDFEAMEHEGGISPAWPIRYTDLEPYYSAAEQLYQVRGDAAGDPSEPPHSTGYPYPPVPDEQPIASVRSRLETLGLRPFSLPLAVDIDRWLDGGQTPWDAFPDTNSGKMDAETCGLAEALKHPNVAIETSAEVTRLITAPGGGRIEAVEYRDRVGNLKRLTPKVIVLSAGAVNSAALLLRSANDDHPSGLANRSDQVGRNFMNHNTSALLSIDLRRVNDCVYQKTIGLNDFYLDDGNGGPPLGNVQLLGRVSAPILKANLKRVPTWLVARIARHAIDWYVMSEDLPDPDSRVRIDGASRIVLDWRRSNMAPHRKLVARMRRILRQAGFPIVLSKQFDRRTPSHQCGTVRFGDDPATSSLDPFCRAHDHANLFVVDASFMPSSAAVNPALTVAAQALRTADHLTQTDLAA